MSMEIREGGVTLGGKSQTVRGAKLKVGDKAPDFELIANDFRVKTLDDYEDKVKL